MRPRFAGAFPVVFAVCVLTAVVVPAPGASAVPPSHDAFASPVVIGALPFHAEFDMAEATSEAGEPDEACFAPIGATVWYRFTPAADLAVTLDTAGSDYDTVLAVYEGDDLGDLTEVSCKDDTDTLQARTGFLARAGTTYSIQVGGFFGDVGSLVFDVLAGVGVSGTITDGDGDPLEDAYVAAFDPDDEFFFVDYSTTANAGEYFLPLVAGDYKLEIGYWSDQFVGSEWYDDHADFASADVVTVADGLVTGGIDASIILEPRVDLAVTDIVVTQASEFDHDIAVDVTNSSTLTVPSRPVTVRACGRTTSVGCPAAVVIETGPIGPGATVTVHRAWDATGTFGDARIQASVEPLDSDPNFGNDSRTEFYGVVVQGAGAGISIHA